MIYKSLHLAPGYPHRGRPVQGALDLARDLQHARLLPGVCWRSSGPPDPQVSEEGILPPSQDRPPSELHWVHEKGRVQPQPRR